MTHHLLALLPLLAACGDGLLGGADVTAGECEGSPYEKSLDTGAPAEPDIWAEADGSDILLHLDDLTANCCPDASADVTRDDFDLTVEFEDVKSGYGCDCMCITDFLVEIGDNDPGTYTIDVVYDGEDLASTTVDVT
jgi:hypothetical protein